MTLRAASHSLVREECTEALSDGMMDFKTMGNIPVERCM